jgi:hypothetical protein
VFVSFSLLRPVGLAPLWTVTTLCDTPGRPGTSLCGTLFATIFVSRAGFGLRIGMKPYLTDRSNPVIGGKIRSFKISPSY